VQVCPEYLLKALSMENKLERRVEKIAGINHLAQLLEIRARYGNDLYPEIKKRATAKN
jgi:alpha-galactosidase